MKLYRVTAGSIIYAMHAPNIQAASQFVKHWRNVTVERIHFIKPR